MRREGGREGGEGGGREGGEGGGEGGGREGKREGEGGGEGGGREERREGGGKEGREGGKKVGREGRRGGREGREGGREGEERKGVSTAHKKTIILLLQKNWGFFLSCSKNVQHTLLHLHQGLMTPPPPTHTHTHTHTFLNCITRLSRCEVVVSLLVGASEDCNRSSMEMRCLRAWYSFFWRVDRAQLRCTSI